MAIPITSLYAFWQLSNGYRLINTRLDGGSLLKSNTALPGEKNRPNVQLELHGAMRFQVSGCSKADISRYLYTNQL